MKKSWEQLMGCDPETSRRNGAKSKGPITERGKAIASGNATKHGLLAQKPPILASEDLETFQGIVQGLVDQYQPDGPLEWHYVQTIAMCIQRQHRAWAAEAALGNAELLPPVIKPYTDEKYPTKKASSFDLGDKSEFHPDNLQKEREILTYFLKRYQIDSFPTERRSKYWCDIWEDWSGGLQFSLKNLQEEYPIDHDQLQDKTRFDRWIRELNEQNHPYGKIWFYLLGFHDCPRSKLCWEHRRDQFVELLDSFQGRLQQIADIEAEIQREKERYEQETEERRLATVNLIPEQIALISRYESHISKQMEKAIAQLSELQNKRKT